MADLKEAHLFKSVQEQRRHWYYRLKLAAIRHELERAFCLSKGHQPLLCLDIGAGNGVISKGIGSFLQKIALKWDLVDLEYQPHDLAASDGNFCLYCQVPNDKLYDLVIAVDVIEHVSNDNEFSARLESYLAKDGILILCAPAFKFLWSSHDVFLGHQRRYTLKGLANRLKSATVVRKRYIYQSIFPIAIAARMIARFRGKPAAQSDLRVYPWVINQLLFMVAMVGEQLASRCALWGLIPGLSCLVVARNELD